VINELTEVESFPTDRAFYDMDVRIIAMVQKGKLKSLGLDPAESGFYVEVYEDLQGTMWKLANPDHAFRGYLKRA
jgi:hypothetical protein